MTIDSEVLDHIVSEEHFPDKAVIIKEGSNGDWIYVILEGRVKIKKWTSRGMLTLDTLSEGHFVGEMALFRPGGTPRAVSAVAEGPVLLGTLDIARLARDWEVQPPRIKKFLSSLVQDIDVTIKKMVDQID